MYQIWIARQPLEYQVAQTFLGLGWSDFSVSAFALNDFLQTIIFDILLNFQVQNWWAVAELSSFIRFSVAPTRPKPYGVLSACICSEIERGLEDLIEAMHESMERYVPVLSKHEKFIRLSHETKNAITERNAKTRRAATTTENVKSKSELVLWIVRSPVLQSVNHEGCVLWTQTQIRKRDGRNSADCARQ